MRKDKSYVAIDLGASSGRAMLGRYNGCVLALEEIHRFDNGPVEMDDGYHWDADRLFKEIKTGIAKAVAAAGGRIESVGVDTWGVDYALIDAAGEMIEQPFNYRDSRTDGMMEQAFATVPREEIFSETGLQFMQINTLFQLLADRVGDASRFEKAEAILLMADLFNYMLTGKRACEHTLASTSQCFNPSTGDWAYDMLDRLGIPTHIFPEVIEAGSVLGLMLPEIADEIGCAEVPVVAVGSHDTASAVAATPAKEANFAYMSLGTWALIGSELSAPVLTKPCLDYNFTNEGGVLGTIRLLKNATGLWIVQECRRIWSEEGEKLSYDQMEQMASDAEPFTAFIDPDAQEFQAPCDMPEKIREFCRRTGQPVPETKGAVMRVALESLALKSRRIIERLEEITGVGLGVLYVVGGGIRNKTLIRFIANATGRQVMAGPVEATALGNIMLQMIAMDDLQTIEEGRALIRRSIDLESYAPTAGAEWDEAYGRMMDVVG